MKKIIFGFVTLVVTVMGMCACSSDDFGNQPGQEVNAGDQPELITLKSGAVVQKQGDKYVWMEDVMLSDAQLDLLDRTGDIISTERTEIDTLNMIRMDPKSGYDFLPKDIKTRSTAIYPTPYNLWAMVRFTYAKQGTGKTLDAYTKVLIKEALQYWENHTNIRFYNATDQPTIDPSYGFAYPYVNFCDGPSNQSYVGRIDGRQDLTLIPNGCTVGNVIHEIGHAIGLLHEQCRYDRDNHITVNLSNILPDARPNFDKRTSNYYCIGAFDFGSVMLYSSYSGFEINPAIPSMERKDRSTFIGQRSGLSDSDKRFPNTFYLPYTARSDVYRELADVVYKADNTKMTEAERFQLQADLNNGNPYPPSGGRIPNDF